MRLTTFMACAMSLLISSPGHSRSQMVIYDGDRVSVGRGGTRVSADGIDFWIIGEPPQRFLVLALITDERCAGSPGGGPVGASSIAAKVKQAGGDAVIVTSQLFELTGRSRGGESAADARSPFSLACPVPVERTTTKMAVVKYLAF